MRRLGHWTRVAAFAGLVLAIPVAAQRDAPESLLPPGFGDRASPTPAPTPTSGQTPPPSNDPRSAAPQPTANLPLDLPGSSQAAAAADDALLTATNVTEAPETTLKYDLPPGAHRSLARVGPLTPESGGLAPDAFGSAGGEYLSILMRSARAPFASRWGSILLRRALLSATDTPVDVDGADWVAERAWLLVRMGEADAARLLIQNVDPDRFSPRLYATAMQVYLASADPAGLCPIVAPASQTSQAPGWTLAKAMCASLSGDQGLASAALNQAQQSDGPNGIDYRLAAKIVGAGFNARRSVTVEWTGVGQLTAWRFGLATAANVDIPSELFATVGPQVRAWQGRSPMLAVAKRQAGVEMAARLGVFSSAALINYYAQLAADSDAPPEFADVADALGAAYGGGSVGARLTGMRTLWNRAGGRDYLGEIAVARAAATLPVSDAAESDMPLLIASMLTAGYDRSAARWAGVVGRTDNAAGYESWGLLAVGAPDGAVPVSGDRIAAFRDADDSVGKRRSRMLLAALAGLGRVTTANAEAALDGVKLNAPGRWSQAIASAAARGEQGTVAVLAAIGLQARDWSAMPSLQLYHIVSALHRVGLDPEARMIAAEAVSRT